MSATIRRVIVYAMTDREIINQLDRGGQGRILLTDDPREEREGFNRLRLMAKLVEPVVDVVTRLEDPQGGGVVHGERTGRNPQINPINHGVLSPF